MVTAKNSNHFQSDHTRYLGAAIGVVILAMIAGAIADEAIRHTIDNTSIPLTLALLVISVVALVRNINPASFIFEKNE